MKISVCIAVFLSLGCSSFCSCGSAIANDTVFLKTGQVLTGTVLEGEAEKGGKFIVLTTESGSVYKLDRRDIVKTVIPHDRSNIEYKKRIALVRDIATDHIKIAKWCADQDRGSTRFAEQIRWHYENVIRLDPDHSEARKALGHMKLSDGSWVVAADFKSRHGYIKKGRHWISALGVSVLANNERIDAENGVGKKALNSWLRKARKGTASLRELTDIADASTIKMLYETAQKVAKNSPNNVELIRALLDAIASVNNNFSVQYLSFFAFTSPNQDVREHAISLLSQPEVNHELAVMSLVQGLRAKTQWHVKTAAIAIGEIAAKNERAALAVALELIESLNTVHTEKIAGALDPGRLNTSFGDRGTGLQTGGGPQTRQVPYKNESSLAALRNLFEADFQYDEARWADWFVANHTLAGLRVRGDE